MQIVKIVNKKTNEEKKDRLKEIAYNAWLIMYGSEMSFYDYLVQLGLEEPKGAKKTPIEIEKDRKEKAKQAIAKAEAIVEKMRKGGGESC